MGVVGILAFPTFLAAAGFVGYREAIKRVKEKQAKQKALAEAAESPPLRFVKGPSKIRNGNSFPFVV